MKNHIIYLTKNELDSLIKNVGPLDLINNDINYPYRAAKVVIYHDDLRLYFIENNGPIPSNINNVKTSKSLATWDKKLKNGVFCV